MGQLPRLLHGESAQNSLEYMLVIGAVAALILAALVVAFPAVVHAVAGMACPSIDTAASPPANYATCLVP